MVVGVKVSTSVDKSMSPDPVKHCIPGFNTTSTERKPFDKHLSPFISSTSKTIQYGDTSIASVSTDNPAWSPGDSLFLHNYEGKFRRKKSIMNSPVFFNILNNVLTLNFRIQSDQEKPKQEKKLQERRQGLTSEERKFRRRRKGTDLKNRNNQIYFAVKLKLPRKINLIKYLLSK